MRIKSKVAAETVTAKIPCKRGRKPKAVKAAEAAAAAAAAANEEKSVTFSVRADAGKTVFLAGSFNQWDPAGKKMLDKKNEGIYSVSIKLAPGSYQYKFVIDGTWCADPENLDFVQNEHGTLNSVVVVK